ncbi:MAG TPA: MFS transporter [Pyrinomonadaceae bacterium]|jgi:MFS family permease
MNETTAATDAGVAPGAATAGAAHARVPAVAWYALGVLTLVYVLNFLDRVLIYILFPPIQKELKFSDLQLALLGTTSFTIFYTLLGIPFGRLADRATRKYLIAAGLGLWSLFSGLTGFAGSFTTLFLCRVGVGVGEATLGPAALSLLSDHFPPRMRATVLAVYSSGITIGGGLAFFLGGWIGQHWGWRWAFYVLGFPGLLLCVFVLSLKEKRRGATESAPAHYTARDWRLLLRVRPLLYLYAGYALYGLASNSLSVWMPTFFARVYKLPLGTIGLLAGILSVVAGVPGTILGGVLADRLKRRGRGGRLMFGACGALVSIPIWLVVLFSQNAVVLVLTNYLLLVLALMWLGSATADVHDIAGPQLRGLGIGLFFFAVNLMSYGVGAPLIGRLNDRLGVAANPEMMRYSLLVCPAACAVAALLLWRGSRRLAQTPEPE